MDDPGIERRVTGKYLDAAVRRERRQVKQRPATRGTHLQEALKQSKLAYGKRLANIATGRFSASGLIDYRR